MAERADAARNRQAILAAAERLIIERGPDAVTMDEIALAAGVGKGTLFRRFGDRSGLIHELLDQYRDEVTNQVDTACAAAADPVHRLLACLGVLFDESRRLRPLIAALEAQSAPGACCRPGDGRHGLLAELITQANPARAGSADFLAHALLAAMRAELVRHVTEDLGTPIEQVRADLLALARASVISETVATT
ncbi:MULTISPECIES: TetR/AcrR family transcriptional regulator [unclassified Crossiella]|uniref:TetR/AcrR family transcriptional regulator n=1 Tax=unclassified Crossiella TaxID=2620835 RepID=UPI001FFEE0D5|nr:MULTISPECIES: TetR/AcrR family transcriptional regulator [unclassified Crossiella]MCK2242553.1 TetR/AcrR family transcriptional regulator [Crossiella sp. S99.2]MCK2254417.1 TetR/AcrR family transcriptional regulator [Crossiella sp. S99.1]